PEVADVKCEEVEYREDDILVHPVHRRKAQVNVARKLFSDLADQLVIVGAEIVRKSSSASGEVGLRYAKLYRSLLDGRRIIRITRDRQCCVVERLVGNQRRQKVLLFDGDPLQMLRHCL